MRGEGEKAEVMPGRSEPSFPQRHEESAHHGHRLFVGSAGHRSGSAGHIAHRALLLFPKRDS